RERDARGRIRVSAHRGRGTSGSCHTERRCRPRHAVCHIGNPDSRAARPRVRSAMNFGHPFLLLTLLLLPAAVLAYRVIARRRVRYAVRYTNVDVLASVVETGRPWRRWVAAGAFLLALAVCCAALARPHMHRLVANENATIVLVLDVSGSMNAQDVKPTRLEAAQRAMHLFLKRVPSRFKVGLVLFAGEAEVATPPTTDRALVGEAIDDALATAVQVGLRSVGITGNSTSALRSSRDLAAYVTAAKKPRASSIVS